MSSKTHILRKIAQREFELLRRKAEKKLLAFTLLTKEDYMVNWHHEAVCEVLDEFIQGKTKRLMVFMPPQTGKTELAVRRTVPQLLGRNPSSRIAVTAYSQGRANKYSKDVQRIMDSKSYQRIYPETGLGKSKIFGKTSVGDAVRQAAYFEIVDNSGFLMAVGIDGALTGETIDISIVDDPYKNRAQADSPAIKKKVMDYYIEVVRTRLHNDSQELILNTRWSHDDLCGELIERDGVYDKDLNPEGWLVVSFPAIKENEENPYDLRMIGEVLWQEKHSLARMLDIKKKNPKVFACLYQQNPDIPGGHIILREWLQQISLHEAPRDLMDNIVDVVVDCAETEDAANDPTGMLAYIVIEPNIYFIDYLEVRERFSKMYKTVFSFVKKNGDGRSNTTIEPKSFGGAVVSYLKDNSNLNIVEWEMTKGSKLQRFRGVEGFFAGRRVFLLQGEWNASFIQKCMRFTGSANGVHDEPIDCSVMAVTEGLLRNHYFKEDDYGETFEI